MRLNYFVLYVSDLYESFDFYSELGFELLAEKHGKGPKHYSFSLDELVIELYPAHDNRTSFCRLGIDLNHGSKLLELLGKEPQKIVKDPDGNVLHFRKI